ncbi:MAG TPA: putative Ig domain-containing protein, partial [Bryobacteraceae bacterium]|nr:putative Ig domain-containing protein [Bryobacteraceae bacterium]
MLEYKRSNLALILCLTLVMATAVVCQAQPLTITTTQLPNGQFNLPYSASLSATGGTPPYTWSYVGGGLPPGLSVSPAGVISGTPTAYGDLFTVQVTDANYPQSAPAQSTLFIGFCNTSANSSSQGHTFEDPGGPDVLSVSNPCGPLTPGTTVPWINVTGFVNGDGFDNINVNVASNTTPVTRTGNVTFTFNQVSPVLVISYTLTQYAKLLFSTPSPLPLGVIGMPYSVSLQAAGGSGINRSFAITSGSLPPGLAFSGQTISGIPTQPGASAFTAQVTDDDGFSGASFSGTQNYAVNIVPPVSITAGAVPGAIAGLPYLATLAATGGVPPYSWSITSGVLPSGIFLTPATGVISGTPAATAQGSYAFTIRATDSVGLAATAPFQLVVDPTPLVIRNPTLAAATEGVAFGAAFSATGGTPPYSWSASGLPSWLTLTSAGQLSGTPPLGSAGSYNFTITVEDNASRLNGVSFTLQVNPGPLAIATSSPLPRAKEGTQVSFAFQASGGVSPYTWSATGLPVFLNLSAGGLLSGTPPVESAGSY